VAARTKIMTAADAEIALLPPVSSGEGNGHPISNPGQSAV
jgi:hypothetical protein